MKEKDVLIKFPSYQEDLDMIAESLDCNVFVPEDTLQKFLFRLRKIDAGISLKSNTSPQEFLSKKKKMVSTLTKKCEDLKEREQIISFAEEAEEIANSSPFLTKEEVLLKILSLQNRIDDFSLTTRPSAINMKFLRFAKKLLVKAEKHEPVICSSMKKENYIPLRKQSPGEITLDEFALAEDLYELASILYDGKVHIFHSLLEQKFSRSSKKEIHFHVHNCGGNIHECTEHKDRIMVIQGLLGFAHTVTDYYSEATPYPSEKDIVSLFDIEMY